MTQVCCTQAYSSTFCNKKSEKIYVLEGHIGHFSYHHVSWGSESSMWAKRFQQVILFHRETFLQRIWVWNVSHRIWIPTKQTLITMAPNWPSPQIGIVSFTLLYGHVPHIWNLLVDFFLRPTIKSFIQGFLPGIALKIFLILLPSILMFMSKVEGLTSISSLERRSASKYYIFIFFNVFLASIIAGSALEQLKSYIHQSANEYVLGYPFMPCH